MNADVELTPFAALTRHGPPLLAPPELCLDPQRVADAPLLKRLRALDEAFFGPRGQAMPSWVLYDCALAPGVVFGLAAPSSELPADWRSDTSGDELVPVAMVSLLPLPRTSRHLIHTLAWRGDGAFGREVLALAVSATGLTSFRVVTGWSSPELVLFAERGPLRLISAWTPAHDVLATVTADLDAGPSPSLELAPVPTGPSEMQALQAAIEAGAPRYLVVADGRILLGELAEVKP